MCYFVGIFVNVLLTVIFLGLVGIALACFIWERKNHYDDMS